MLCRPNNETSQNAMSRHLNGGKTQKFGIGPSSEEFAFLDKTLKPDENCSLTYPQPITIANVIFKKNKNEFKMDFFVSSKKPLSNESKLAK